MYVYTYIYNIMYVYVYTWHTKGCLLRVVIRGTMEDIQSTRFYRAHFYSVPPACSFVQIGFRT